MKAARARHRDRVVQRMFVPARLEHRVGIGLRHLFGPCAQLAREGQQRLQARRLHRRVLEVGQQLSIRPFSMPQA